MAYAFHPCHYGKRASDLNIGQDNQKVNGVCLSKKLWQIPHYLDGFKKRDDEFYRDNVPCYQVTVQLGAWSIMLRLKRKKGMTYIGTRYSRQKIDGCRAFKRLDL